MPHRHAQFDPIHPALTPGFQAGSRIRCQWYGRVGERPSLFWRADVAPGALNWARALKASAGLAAPVGG